MRNKGPIIFLILALALAGAAAWGAHRWIQAQALEKTPKGPALTPVVVATAKMNPGQRLQRKHLIVKGWPKAAVPAGSFRKPDSLVGRVLRSPLGSGEVVLVYKLAPKGVSGGLSAIVPPGSRALTVRVDDVIGVGGFVQLGDRVDVLVTLSRGMYQDSPTTRTVLQDIPVLAVGDRLVEEQAPKKGKKPKKVKVKVVTLQLTPEQGERLALAATEGKVLLALRNQGDRDKKISDGVTMVAMVPPPGVTKKSCPKKGGAATGGTAVAGRSGPSIEIIKGVVVSQQEL